ncbi:hypothetical protein Tco_0941115 [Tanacetum coccineum]|uniref:Uncharacterized protein n=1 Tax=Tanacetum coccineum TaxID=301880 RepID=A0ABQ5DPY4_9ASTR
MQTQEGVVNEGVALDAGLDSKASTDDNTSTEQQDGSNSSEHVVDAERARVDTIVFDKESATVRPSYDNNTLTEQATDSLTKALENLRENLCPKQTKNESEYCKKIKFLNEEISNLKSQACQKEKSFHKENEKYVEYVQPLLNRKNELEKTNQEFLKQINDLNNKLLKTGQTAQTFHMLLPKEDDVNTGRQGLGFDIQNDVENPFILNKSKGLTPSLYNIDEMGKDLPSDHKIISEEELKCEAEKRLKVKRRKSPLSYHGFVYGDTQFVEPPKVPLKRRQVNLKKHVEQAQLVNYDPKLWNSLPMKYFCFVKHSMLNFEKQMVLKQEVNRREFITPWDHEADLKRNVQKRLSEEFEPLARNINLQLNSFEKSLVKEMKDDLKYVVSLEDEFDEKCLILDIQKEFFKTHNEAKLKTDIHVIESINIELECKVAKLLAENEHLKAQIQEKVFATAALKNELRKSKGNSVDTKFAKPSILGKPPLQPLRNQSVVRQPNAFKSERPKFSKQRFASQVDVNNDLPKPVTPHYWPNVRAPALVKPHHVIASSESRNNSKNMPRFSSNDMVHNHYLEEAKKKTQERDRNSKTSVMPSARLPTTANGSKPKPRNMNQMTRNCPTHKSSYVTKTGVPKADHPRNSSSFSDSKRFVCSTCQKCVFNENHNACITNLLKEVKSRGKKQSHKTTKRFIPVEKKSNAKKPARQIPIGQKFSPTKSSAVYLKTTPPRSGLTWKPTGRIFRNVCLRWIPTGKLFDSCKGKVDSEPTTGSNVDIPNVHVCKQTLDISAGTSLASQQKQRIDFYDGTLFNVKQENLRPRSTMSTEVPTSNMIVMTSMPTLESLFGPLFDEYFNGENLVVSKSSAVTTADASDKRQQQPDSTSSTSTLATTVTADGNFELYMYIFVFSLYFDL